MTFGLLVKVIHRAPARVVARAHRAAPPADIAQERVERRKFVLDAIPCEHVEVLQEHRNDFLPPPQDFFCLVTILTKKPGRSHLELAVHLENEFA